MTPIPQPKNSLAEIYRLIVIITGFLLFFYCLHNTFYQETVGLIAAMCLVTFLVAWKIAVKFPNHDVTISLSDPFVFVSMIMFGVDAVVIVSLFESIGNTLKIRNQSWLGVLFNPTINVLGTFITAQTVTYIFGAPSAVFESGNPAKMVAVVALMSLMQFVCVPGFHLIYQFLKSNRATITVIYNYLLWASLTYFAGGAVAGGAILLYRAIGFAGLAVLLPVSGVLYITYRNYLRNVDALQSSEIRFRSSFDHAAIGMALVSVEGRWLQVNEKLCEIFQRSPLELLASSYLDSFNSADLAEMTEKMAEMNKTDMAAFQTELRFLNRGGEDVWAMLNVSAARDSQGQLRHYIFQIQNITLRKQAEEKLRHEALHDALTGLPNRASFAKHLEQALVEDKADEDKILAILFLDLDGFKLVNDSLGHAVGDELLKATAQRLSDCVRLNDVVARLGGDEFTILLKSLNDMSQAATIADRIIERLSEPFLLADQEVFIGTSIGIATTEFEYSTSGDLLRDADAAMYQAKDHGKGCYAIFDQEMHAHASKLLRLANDLRRAIERQEFVIHYQPIQDLASEMVCGFEALIRWNHPTYGLLPPSEFIGLAEENGLINRIDNWTLHQACSQLKEWHDQYEEMRDVFVSVNVSTKQFAQIGLVDYVRQVLQDTELAAHCLQLEITESAMMKSLKNTARILEDLSFIGVNIALDDFGTGYSSLSYLHELPISTLKVDRSFVNRMTNGGDGGEIVKAIISLAHSLKMDVVAEGIEVAEHLEMLRKMGCDSGQGYYFSRPVTASEILRATLKSRRWEKVRQSHNPENTGRNLRLVG